MSSAVVESNASTLRQDLHDLCQPLTRLQWRLELGRRSEHASDLSETIAGALDDVVQLTELVRRLRATVEAAATDAQGRAA